MNKKSKEIQKILVTIVFAMALLVVRDPINVNAKISIPDELIEMFGNSLSVAGYRARNFYTYSDPEIANVTRATDYISAYAVCEEGKTTDLILNLYEVYDDGDELIYILPFPADGSVTTIPYWLPAWEYKVEIVNEDPTVRILDSFIVFTREHA